MNPAAQRGQPASALEHLIMRRAGQAIGDFGLVKEGDRILVGISGGKDSFALLRILELLRRRFVFEFQLVPVFVDPGWDPAAAGLIQERLAGQGFSVEVVGTDIHKRVLSCLRPRTNPCALCSRLRRGWLYDLAPERGCNKIALGHHLDDFVETLLLNQFHTGQLKSMAIFLHADDGQNAVIRPLAYVERELLVGFSRECGFEPVEVCCPYHTRSQDPRRVTMTRIIEQMCLVEPRTRRNLLAALKHVRPTHLMDPRLQPKHNR